MVFTITFKVSLVKYFHKPQSIKLRHIIYAVCAMGMSDTSNHAACWEEVIIEAINIWKWDVHWRRPSCHLTVAAVVVRVCVRQWRILLHACAQPSAWAGFIAPECAAPSSVEQEMMSWLGAVPAPRLDGAGLTPGHRPHSTTRNPIIPHTLHPFTQHTMV